MGSVEQGGGCHDGGICGQRVCPECGDGLSAAPADRPAGGSAPPAETVSACGFDGRRLCRSGVPALGQLFVRRAGKGGGRCAVVAAGLRRGGKAAPPDAAAVHGLLRLRGLCAGAGTVGGQRRAYGERHLLHGRKRQSPADRRRRGISGADGGVPVGGKARCRRRDAPGADLRRRPDHRADRPVGQRKRIAGSSGRTAGAGGGSRRSERRAAAGSPADADTGGAQRSGGPAGACAPGGAGAAAPSGAVSRGGDCGRPAAGGAHRLDGDRRDAVSRTVRGPFADGAGNGIHSPVGRRGQKGRKS